MTAVIFGLTYGGAVIVGNPSGAHLEGGTRRAAALHRDQPLHGGRPGPVPGFRDPRLLARVPRLITAMAATRMLTLWVSLRRKTVSPAA